MVKPGRDLPPSEAICFPLTHRHRGMVTFDDFSRL
jgi:hypothetical protein